MKQIARIRMNGGNTVTVKLKPNEPNFTGPDGLLYNAPNRPGEWGIEKRGLSSLVQESLYHEGIPSPVGAKEIETMALNGHGEKPMKVKVLAPVYEGFGADEFTRIYGEPIQMWLANAIQRAQGGLMLQYVTIGLAGLAALAAGAAAYLVHKHAGG